MTQMSQDESVGMKVKLETACPDCGSELFNPGPRGGHAHNIRCAQCGSKFWFSPPFTPTRIDSEDRFFCLTLKFTTAQIISGDGLKAVQNLLLGLIQ